MTCEKHDGHAFIGTREEWCHFCLRDQLAQARQELEAVRKGRDELRAHLTLGIEKTGEVVTENVVLKQKLARQSRMLAVAREALLGVCPAGHVQSCSFEETGDADPDACLRCYLLVTIEEMDEIENEGKGEKDV
jgi:hypothetical protein